MTAYETARHIGYLIIAVSPLLVLFYYLFKEPLQRPYTEDDWHDDQDEYYIKAHEVEKRNYNKCHEKNLTDGYDVEPQDIRKLPEW